ncbi:MAG: iron-containing alcohol dehydrogenase [Pseudomonadota bacterium]
MSIPAFQMASVPSIRFGPGARHQLPEMVREHNPRRVMVITAGFVAEHYATLFEAMTAEAPLHRVLVRGEPSPETIDALVAEAPGDIDLVIGVGGGSVLDAAKSVGGLLPERHSVIDYLEGVGCGRRIAGDTVPFIAVPTTAGTGSETTKNAVITRIGAFKKSFRDERLLARAVILDPEFLEGCPAETLYATGMDAFTQLLESYTTRKANPVTDALSWQGMTLFKGAFEAVESADARMREDGLGRLMLAASLSGICLANAGLGAVHGLAGPVGAFFEAPHGVVCARLLAPVTRRNIAALRAEGSEESLAVVERYAAVGELMTGRRDPEELVKELEAMTARYSPEGLSRFGLTRENVAAVLANCRSGSMLGNPLVLDDDCLFAALNEAL